MDGIARSSTASATHTTIALALGIGLLTALLASMAARAADAAANQPGTQLLPLSLVTPSRTPPALPVAATQPPGDVAGAAHSPLAAAYSRLPGFAHAQCANQCQMSGDKTVQGCRSANAAMPAQLTCMQEARKTYQSCVNACPVDSARLP